MKQCQKILYRNGTVYITPDGIKFVKGDIPECKDSIRHDFKRIKIIDFIAETNRENVKRYQLECYQALYTHFAGSLRRRVEENEAEIKALQAVNEAIKGVKAAKAAQKEAEEHLDAIRKARLDTAPTLF